MAKKTALEQIKELDDQKKALTEEAKQEALDKANEAISDLKALGFNYRLTSGKNFASSKGSVSDGPCPYCGFETSPPHDGRKHRSQGDKKKAFTTTELKDLGLAKA